MPTILIADSSKPSVVMTSEIFKDKVPGISIQVANTGKAALEMIAVQSPDLCVVDFDLPDVDGPALVENLRKYFNGPILMTAYPDDIVRQAVTENLFTCADASSWISKPISSAELCASIEKFLTEKHRINKRFASNLTTQLVGKASGRGKRAPKVKGHIVNLSIGGGCIKLDGVLKIKKQQELTMFFQLPNPNSSSKGGKQFKKKPTLKDGTDAKVKAKVAWVSTGHIGISFQKLSDVQKKNILGYLRECHVLEK